MVKHSQAPVVPTLAGLCIACGARSPGGRYRLCEPCEATVTLRRPTIVPGDPSLFVSSWALHEGAPRRLVIRLKYQGLVGAAEILADGMVAALDRNPSALVPVPRAPLRRLRYGIDPARALAQSIGRRVGAPVIDALRPPVWWRPHAGSKRAGRRPPRFAALRSVPDGVLLIDDVMTTGATLAAANTALRRRMGPRLGHVAGATATSAGTMSMYAFEAHRRRS